MIEGLIDLLNTRSGSAKIPGLRVPNAAYYLPTLRIVRRV